MVESIIHRFKWPMEPIKATNVFYLFSIWAYEAMTKRCSEFSQIKMYDQDFSLIKMYNQNLT